MTSEQAAKESLPVGYVWAPRFAEFREGRLRAETSVNWIKRRAPRDLLKRFVNLAESPNTERAVIGFAKQWGIVGLCKHGLPIPHQPACKDMIDTIDAHHSFALLLDALLRIGLGLNGGCVADYADWEVADSILYDPGVQWSREQREADLRVYRASLPMARTRFQAMMRELTKFARLQPRFSWSDGAWAIDFDALNGSNLAAILTIQLMAEIGGQAMRQCRSCPRWFAPRGRQVYCKACGIRAAWRDAKKRQRHAP